jgi:hypothetical protein
VADIPAFEDYVGSLAPLTTHVDPIVPTEASADLHNAALSLADLPELSASSLAHWVHTNPNWVPALGLAMGLSQEKLKNVLKNHFDTSSWQKLAKKHPVDLAAMFVEHFDLLRLLEEQRNRTYDFGDILVARAGSRVTATRAGASGRRVEDEIETIAHNLGLPCETRTRFKGRNNRTAPCDLVIPNADHAAIAVAAKGFDSTGSKLTDAVREVEEMASVRMPRQFIIAVIDGIGWKSRKSDLQRIYDLWQADEIDGMYTLATLPAFQSDLETAAHLRGLLPS